MKRIFLFLLIALLALPAQITRAESGSPDDPAVPREERIRRSREQISRTIAERQKQADADREKIDKAAAAERERLQKEQDEKGKRMQRAIDEQRARAIEAGRQQRLTESRRSYDSARRRQDEVSARNDTPTTWTRLSTEFVPHQVYRGDTLTVHGVTATWEFTESNKSTTHSLGRIRFKSPQKSAVFEISNETFRDRVLRFYIAPVSFEIRSEGSDASGRIVNLSFGTVYQPDRINLTGGSDDFALYISQTNPVSMQDELWSISEQPKTYPDGSKIHQLEIRGADGKIKAEVPLTNGSYREIGRYYFIVREFHALTGTVMLGVQVHVDPTIKGRWAYMNEELRNGRESIHNMVVRGAKFGDIIKELAEDCGIQVTWKEADHDPKSISYIQNYTYRYDSHHPFSMNNVYYPNEFMRTLVNAGFPIGYEWKSNTELVIWPRDYDKVLAEQKKQEDIKRQNEAILKKFGAEYQAVTKVYPLRSISPATAYALIKSELHEYGIVKRDQYAIEANMGHDSYLPNKSILETAIADERANALIVTAIPETHAKIAKMLEKIDKSLAPGGDQIPDQYQIEVILLRGDASGTSTLPSYLKAKDLEPLGIKSVTQIGRAMMNLVGEKGSEAKAALGGGYSVELAFLDERKPYLIVRGTLTSTGAVSSAPAKPAEPTKTVFTLKRGEEKEIDGATFRLVRADSASAGTLMNAEIIINYGGNTYSTRLTELSTVVYGEFEITADRIAPAAGNKGEGQVQIRVRHFQPALAERDIQKSKGQLLENTVFLEPGKPALLGLTNMRESLILVIRSKE